MFCAISGEAPQVPVVSTKSGNVYEKRLIEAYIIQNGTEPTTGEALAPQDLIDLKSQKTTRPRPPSVTSIPAVLGILQEEWDSLALETYTLRQNLTQARQDLSNALYQHDAAVRVIARLTKERDQAREALASVNVRARAPTNGDAMRVDSTPLPDSIVTRIRSIQDGLMKTRRKRPVPEDWATGDDISSYTPQSTSKSFGAGDKVFSVNGSGDLALVGGVDGELSVYAVWETKVRQSFNAGGGSITDAAWVGDRVAISTVDGKVLVLSSYSEAEPRMFESHKGSATAIAVHAGGELLASVGEDSTYAIYDLQSMTCLTQVQTESSLTCLQFHPDGHLLAVGAVDGRIRIFDVSSSTEGASFALPAAVKTLKFSENGIWLACVADASTAISVWDVRKLANGELMSLETGIQIETMDWDYTGQFLAAAGSGGIVISQYLKASKEWIELLKNSNATTSVVWGKAARSLLTTSTDGAVSLLAR